MSIETKSIIHGAAALAAAGLLAGCATKNVVPEAELPQQDRVEYDPDLTMDLAVQRRLQREREQLLATLDARDTAAPPASVVQVPAPQLIPAPEVRGERVQQGPAANPVEQALSVVGQANEQAERRPTPDGFLNAIHYFDYAEGLRFNAVAATGHITTVQLRAGEEVLTVSASDTESFVVQDVVQGTGESARTLLLIKPTKQAPPSNWVIVTDERTYFLDLLVSDNGVYQSMIAWNYPNDGLRVLSDRRERARLRAQRGGRDGLTLLSGGGGGGGGQGGGVAPGVAVPTAASFGGNGPDAGPVVGPAGADLEALNFGYVLLYQERGRDGKDADANPPAWAPLRVFDDGRKTFIQFPPSVRHVELPPVWSLDHPSSDRAQVVNVRRAGDYLVLDQTAVALEMRAGEAPQQVVKIVRGKATDPGTVGDAEGLRTSRRGGQSLPARSNGGDTGSKYDWQEGAADRPVDVKPLPSNDPLHPSYEPPAKASRDVLQWGGIGGSAIAAAEPVAMPDPTDLIEVAWVIDTHTDPTFASGVRPAVVRLTATGTPGSESEPVKALDAEITYEAGAVALASTEDVQ